MESIVFYARFTPEGRYTEAGTTSSSSPWLLDPDIYIGAVNPLGQYHTPAGPVDMPPCPGRYYIFDYSTKQWAADTAGAWADIRSQRDALLRGCDWTQLPDTSLAPGAVANWRTYRQQLRDVTNQTDPMNIVWPTPPA